jgi:hypothetical protein
MPRRPKSGSNRRRKLRSRDYRAEYRRRVQGGLSRGLSISQARGHARAGERPRPPNPIPVNPKSKEEVAIRIMRDTGASLRYTARLTGLSEQHLRRYIKENVGAERVGRSWVFNDQRPRRYPVYSENRLKTLTLTPPEASRAAEFMNAVCGRFLPSGDITFLVPFEGEGVTDINGRFHPFEVDPNRLYELDATGELNFPEFYRIIN